MKEVILRNTRSRLADNLRAVEARVVAACARVQRAREEVTLIAVTKYVTPETAALLPELGVRHLGESRPQELWKKAEALPKDVYWHFVGHLQRNKVEKTLPLVAVIHSVDSERLLATLSAEGEKLRRPVDVLLEVNLSREPNKHGFAPDRMPLLQPDDPWPYPGVFPLGLMTMAAETENPEAARATFAELRNLAAQIRGRRGKIGGLVKELSMGMTGDFEIAIEEGATMVRIGSALFEGIDDGDAH